MKWDDKTEKTCYMVGLVICWLLDIWLWVRWFRGETPYIGNALISTVLISGVTAFMIYDDYKNKKGE